MDKIPNEYHFIFGLSADFGEKPFSLIHYLAVLSCYKVNRPSKMTFHYEYEPKGIWWERAKPYLCLAQVDTPVSIYGRPLKHYAHRADVLRLQILIDFGGIYLDLDVLCLRPFADLRHFAVVLGKEGNVGLCNAVVLAKKNSSFLKRWLAFYASFDDGNWNYHSVILPSRLVAEASEVHVVDDKSFFWPIYNRADDMRQFFLGKESTFCQQSYCVHLWESLTWGFLRDLTEDDLNSSDSEFYLLARNILNAR